MSKQPYIPLYIGDWERDTNCLSLEAEGALLKLIFKMWDSANKGKLEFSFNQLSILLKKSEENTLKIVSELHENGTLNIEFIGKDRVKFESRRILKDIAKSLIYRENGSKGGRPVKPKQKLTKSKSKAKGKLITDNDIDNDIESDNVFEKGKRGTGEKTNGGPSLEIITHLNDLNGTNLRPDTKATVMLINQRIAEGYTVQELKEIIEYKIAEWKGTEWEKYLQPDTLFNAAKCAKYRNQVQAAKDKGSTLSQIRARPSSGKKTTAEIFAEVEEARERRKNSNGINFK